MVMQADQTAKSEPRPRRRNWLLPLAVTLVMLLLLTLPYWLGYATARPGTFFTGILMNPEDAQTYFAKMLQGYDGQWRYRIVFTAEPHDPIFLGGFYLALGHLARLLDVSLPVVWHGAQAVGLVALLWTTYGFVAHFVRTPRARTAAYLLTIFGSGLGWLLFLSGTPYWLDSFPVDFKMPEARLFFTALTFPHIMFSTALLLAGFWLLLQALHAPGRGTGQRFLLAGLAGLANLVMSILHPLLIYLVVAVVSLYWLGLTLRARRILWLEGFLVATSLAVPALVYLYYAYELATNAVLRGWDSQRESTQSPPWPHYLVAYGPLLLPALLLPWQRWRQRVRWSNGELFLWLWVMAVALLVYAPLNSQRRFVQGVPVPLSILAAWGLQQVVWPWLSTRPGFQRLAARPRYSPAGLARFLTVVFLLFMALSNAYLWASITASAAIPALQPDLLFRPLAEQQAANWLRQHTGREDVIFGEYETGNYVAAQAGNRVVIGHWAETVNFAQKEADVARFYQPATDDAWRRAFLQAQGVRYLWYGPREQALGSFDPATLPGLQPVYQAGDLTIYAVPAR